MYTPDGLPVVSEDQVKSYLAHLERLKQEGTLGEYTVELFERLEEDNPELVYSIAAAIDALPAELAEEVGAHLFGVYELLRRQAEANKLAEGLEVRVQDPQ